MTINADLSGIPLAAWQRGREKALAGHVPSIGADDHVLAVSFAPPWVEQRWPPRRGRRTVTLHGSAYDQVRLDLYGLGQLLTVGGEHGPAEYEHKEHDDTSAAYTAVEDVDVPAIIPASPQALEAAVEPEHMEALF